MEEATSIWYAPEREGDIEGLLINHLKIITLHISDYLVFQRIDDSGVAESHHRQRKEECDHKEQCSDRSLRGIAAVNAIWHAGSFDNVRRENW